MSITWGVLAQSPKSKAHDKVLDNNRDQLGIWKINVFLRRRRKLEYPERKTSLSKERTNNKLDAFNPYENLQPETARIRPDSDHKVIFAA